MTQASDMSTILNSGRGIHTWFGLTYASYLVLPRTLLQSMPQEWQHRFVVMLEQMDEAFAHVPKAGAYKVDAAEEREVSSLTPDQMAALGITSEDGPCREEHDHDATEGADCRGEPVYTDATGQEMQSWERVLIPVKDPVPHYSRGRTRIEPALVPDGIPRTADPTSTAMTTCYMLTESHQDSDLSVVTTDPRRLRPSGVIGERAEHAILPLAHPEYCLAHLEPQGPVTSGGDSMLTCPAGWKVTKLSSDLSAMLGPQASQIRAVIAEAERVLTGDGQTAQAYAAAIDAVYDHGYPEAERLAVEALDAYGADGSWWDQIGGCAYGGEVKALAARDLIGTVPRWTQEMYDLLTIPWVTAFGRGVHPGDTIPGPQGAP